MIKTISLLALFLFISNQSFADDSVKVTVGTQTYLCELAAELSCKAANQVQRKDILLKKNAGKIQVEDKEHNLNAEIATSVDNNNVVYDLTLCSAQACSLSTVTSDSTGKINQVMSGQYNITQKSFYVLGFFISTHASDVNLEDKISKEYLSLLKK